MPSVRPSGTETKTLEHYNQKVDSRTFNTQLASKTGLSAKEAAALSDRLVSTICESLAALDNVAIPGFGNFTSVKTDEHVETNSISGKSMLMPPSITVSFAPGAQLRKTANKA